MELRIEYLSPHELTPYKGNARKHEREDLEQIKESIRVDGFNDPIGIWGAENLIVEGHGRQLAAIDLGLEKVPCIRLDHLTDAQRRDYAIRHNRTAELSSWDWQTLEDELHTLESEGFDTGDLFEECFDAIEESEREEKEKYSREVKIPHYDPKDDDVSVPELFDDTKGNTGALFFTVLRLMLTQEQTQKATGGMSETYIASGTYVKSFPTVMLNPSCVKIAEMGQTGKRIHHRVRWRNAVPKILSESYKR